MNPITGFRHALKRFSMTFGQSWGSLWNNDGAGGNWSTWGRSFISSQNYYAAAHTDPNVNSIVMACVLWICRTFPEAPIQVTEEDEDGTVTPIKRHPLTVLLRKPNPYYSGVLLWYASITDFLTTGNAYWLKVRSGSGKVVELWWVPQFMIQPQWPKDGSVFISNYIYRPDADQHIPIDVQDVVHLRYGIDPRNTRKGLSPLASLLQEIFSDDEAGRFTSAILKNLGVPGVVLSPNDPGQGVVNAEDLERIKGEFMARFGGERRGEPLIMSGKTSVDVLSFSPQQMDLKALRMVPEERISACLGIPAAVAGLGAGLERTKVGATMREMREQAYESCIIPTQRLLAAELDAQLLPEFTDDPSAEVGFDLSKVRVLQADEDKVHERARGALLSGLLTRNKALLMIGQKEEGPDQDVLYIPNTVTPTLPEDLIPPEPAPGTLPLPGASVPALTDRQQSELPPRDGTAPRPSNLVSSDTISGDNRTGSSSSYRDGGKSITRVTPRGRRIGWVPHTVEYSAADRRALADAWNAALPAHAGQLGTTNGVSHDH